MVLGKQAQSIQRGRFGGGRSLRLHLSISTRARNTTRPRAELARISSNRFRHVSIEIGRDWSKFVKKTTSLEYPFSTTLITMVPFILLGYAPFARIKWPKLDGFLTN